ncbi:shikimate dehydrogenase [Actinomadura scrupuli]|uniref:shikimate dehydrogenase n=1 Tax=Actinomadura scrupuli TaxID=559629 RepID=UPI003D9723E4
MRCAVLGSPVGHSLSPVLHRAAYAAMGLRDWSYEAVECDEHGLAGMLKEPWAGLSLTMPLKRVALTLVDTCSELAVNVGGANTILFRDDGLRGDNTDVHGIVMALTEAGIEVPASVLVLGGGATAASALAAVARLGAGRATLAVRTPARAAEAAAVGERFGLSVTVRSLEDLRELPPAGLVVSTLPGAGAAPYAGLIADSCPAVFDVTYAPWPSPLGAAVLAAGGTVVGGFPMLLHQAARQVELMTGRTGVPVEVMRAAGEAELAARAAAK